MKKYTLLTLLSGVLISLSIASAQVTGDVAPDESSSGCTTLSYNLTYKKSKDANTNGEVSDLQYFLQDQGLLTAEPNGIFGPSTLRAVKSFQKKNGFITSGYVGPMTRAKIKEMSCTGNTISVYPEQETTSKKVCKGIGSRSEGWYDSATNELIEYAKCSNTSTAPVACTMEYRSCADGSAMPRDANCKWREDKCSSSALSPALSVEIIGIPELKLQYDSNNKESMLVVKGRIKISTGSHPVNIGYTADNSHVARILGISNNARVLSSPSQKSSAVAYPACFPTDKYGCLIKENSSMVFDVTNTAKTGELFAGTYSVTPSSFNYSGVDNKSYVINPQDYKGLSVSNSVTIIGETSPYITEVISTGVNNYISGNRFDSTSNVVSINGVTKLLGKSVSKGASIDQLEFNLSDFGITKSGKYTVQVIAKNGESNQFETTFNVTSIQSPVIYSVNGKGGFGSGNGDSNSIYGENLINIKEVYLESVDGKKVSLKFSFPDNSKEIIGITVPDSVRGYYSLFVVNSAGLVSNSYKVGYLGAMVPVSQVPTITSITSVPVKVGDIVEVWGTGLSGISTSVGPGDYGVSVNSSSASDSYFSFVVPSYLNVGEHTLMVEKGVLRSNMAKFTIVQNQTLAPTVTISASPTSVVSGGQSTITWSSTGATSCRFTEGDNQFKNYENTISGNNRYTQSLYSSQTYTISCVGSGGTTVKSVAVNIGSTPTVSVISPNGGETWSLGSTQNIRWTTTGNISKVRLDLVDVDTGSVRVSGLTSSNSDMLGLEYNDGSADVMFPNYIPASQYKIRVTDCSNITLNSQPCVNNNTVFDVSNSYFKLANPINGTVVPTATISASPTIIASGQSTVITWSSTNASQCILGGDFATGNGVAQYWKGSVVVTPTKQTSTYSVRCTDSMQTVEKVASVTVNTNSPSVSPVVSFARTAGFVSQNISPNSTNVKIGSFTIQNSSNEYITIGTSTVNLVFSGDFTSNTISNLSVRNFGVPIGYVADTTNYFFSSIPVSVAPYGTQTFDVYADIGSATNGSVTAGMTVYYSGNTSHVSGNVNAIGVSVTPVVSTLANPTLTTSSPVSQFVVGGTNFGIATYRVATEGAGTQAVIRELRFSTTGTDAIMSMTVNGVQGVVVNGNVTISGLSIPVSSSGTDIPVNVQFSGFQNSTTGGSLQSAVSNVGVTLSYVEATSGAGSVITKQTAVSSNKMTLVASKPTVTMSGGRTSQVVLSSVTESKIGEFTVTSDINGKIALSSVTLNFSTTGITGAQFSKVRMSNGSINISTVPNTHAIGSNGSISFDIPSYEISAGQSQTFSVFAIVSGVTQSGISPVVTSRFDSPSLFVWNDIIGGNIRQTGNYIYNFPTSSYSTLGLSVTSSQVLGVSVMCVDIPRNMHRGAESSYVSTLQKFLQDKGFLSEVSGFYGDKTVEAVKDYQASKGLSVTGMVYNLTREIIKKETCQ